MVIRNDPQNEKSIGVRLATLNKSGEEAKSFVAGIEAEWKKLFPKTPFSYSFLNESIARLYNEDNRTAWLMQAATVITILISCM